MQAGLSGARGAELFLLTAFGTIMMQTIKPFGELML
jgi:hypothetical protein